MTTLLNIIEELQQQNISIVPVPALQKAPVLCNWQVSKKFVFSPDYSGNIAILLSNNIIDIDFDNVVAADIAYLLLNNLANDLNKCVIFGRKSKKISHILVRASNGEIKRKQVYYKGNLILELRNNGLVLFPPSIHPSGETLEFLSDINFVTIESEKVIRLFRKFAIAAILAMAWKNGNRHNLALYVSGYLYKKGWSIEEIEQIITTICDYHDDKEKGDRLRAIKELPTKPVIAGISGIMQIDPDVARALEQLFDKNISNRDSNREITLEEIFTVIEEMDNIRIGNNLFFIWDGQKWVKNNNIGILRKPIIAALEKINAPLAWYNRTLIIAEHLKNGAIPAICIRDYKDNPYIIHLPNGKILELEDLKVREQNKNELPISHTNVDYCEELDTNEFEEILTECVGNAEYVQYMQELAGATLVGLSKKIIVMIHGAPDTGKTFFVVNTFAHAMGSYALQISPELAMTKDSSLKAVIWSQAINKRIVILSEPSARLELQTSFLKAISGRNAITVRPLYSQPFTITPTWTLWIDSNFLLPVPEADDAFWRRVHAVRFKNKILANKPKEFFKNWEEYGPRACLKWAAEGANRILHKYTNISDIPVISDSVQEWRSTIEENSVYEFLKKLQNSDKFMQRSVIWNFYKEWSIANNVPAISKNVFYELLDQNFRKTIIKGKRGYYVDIIEEQKEISFYGLS